LHFCPIIFARGPLLVVIRIASFEETITLAAAAAFALPQASRGVSEECA
jgi:hypothetical protein